MSIQGLNWCLENAENCDMPSEVAILFLLSNYADENQSAYPSEKWLGQKARISDRQVRRILTKLVDKGLITVEKRRGTSNRYYLCMDAEVQKGRTPTSSNTKVETKDIYGPEFNEFWKSYPRKVGKYPAAKSFLRESKRVDPKILVQKAKWFAEDQKNTEECFIKHPTTWLNQRLYDEIEKPKIINKKSKSWIQG